MSQNLAAAVVGSSAVTLWRWRVRRSSQGVGGLVPLFGRSGRKPASRKLGVTPEIIARVQRLQAACGSAAAAWRAFARLEECPAALARYIRSRGRGKALAPSVARATGLRRVKLTGYQAGSRVLLVLPAGQDVEVVRG